MKTYALPARLAIACAFGLVCAANLQARTAPHATHPPAAANAERAAMETMQIPSHGVLMNALVYVAAGAGPHPVVVLLHGFPGNERNLDLAQDIRRAGWDVLYFNYRGSWGTHGDFSFAHGIEDTAAAVAYLRRPEVARKLRLDPARIVLIGHSMGGFMAIQTAAADPAIKAIGVISGGDLGAEYLHLMHHFPPSTALERMARGLADEGMAPLSGCTPEGLAREVATHASSWVFTAQAPALKERTVLVTTSDDGLADMDDAFATALRESGDTRVTRVHLSTDHAYSDKRIELSRVVLDWLRRLPE